MTCSKGAALITAALIVAKQVRMASDAGARAIRSASSLLGESTTRAPVGAMISVSAPMDGHEWSLMRTVPLHGADRAHLGDLNLTTT